MRYILVIFMILLAAPGWAEWIGAADTTTKNGWQLTEQTILQAYRCLHNTIVDSAHIIANNHYADDSTWVVIYEWSSGEPGDFVCKTSEVYTGTGTDIWLEFSGSDALSEDQYYFIGIEHRGNGNESNSRFRPISIGDSLHNTLFVYVSDTAQDPWPTGSDTWENDGGDLMPYVKIYHTPSSAYDTTAVETTFTLLNCTYIADTNALNSYGEYGSAQTLLLGKNNYGFMGYQCYPLFSGDSAQQDSMTDWYQNAIDIPWYDSVIITYSSSNNMTTSDTAGIYIMLGDTTGILNRRMYEATANWDSIADPGQWVSRGAATSGSDYWGTVLTRFIWTDTTHVGGKSYYRFGGDTAAYNAHLQWADSLKDGRPWRGYIIRIIAGFTSKNDNIQLTSDDYTPQPVQKMGGYKITAISSSEGTFRHDGNRHDGERH